MKITLVLVVDWAPVDGAAATGNTLEKGNPVLVPRERAEPEARGGAGVELEVEVAQITKFGRRKQHHDNPGIFIAAECSDDGMRPTLSRGDLIVINTADTALEDAAVYAVGYEGSFLVRRLFRDGGAWWLTCDNGSSQRFMRKRFGEKHCFMLGKVVHRQSETI